MAPAFQWGVQSSLVTKLNKQIRRRNRNNEVRNVVLGSFQRKVFLFLYIGAKACRKGLLPREEDYRNPTCTELGECSFRLWNGQESSVPAVGAGRGTWKGYKIDRQDQITRDLGTVVRRTRQKPLEHFKEERDKISVNKNITYGHMDSEYNTGWISTPFLTGPLWKVTLCITVAKLYAL